MMILLAVGIAVAVTGVPLAALGVWVGRMQDTGRHCACDARGLPRPTCYPRHDGSVVVGERGDVRVRPVNGRYLGTRPRRTPWPSAADPIVPAQTDDRPPWSITTTSMPAAPGPVYGEAPVAEVLESERLAKVMIP